MKIVQISSLWESTPPPKYGGLELVVSNLTEELVAQGHEVVLFATGDSSTKAELKATYPRALYRDGVPWTSMYDTLTHVAEAVRFAKEWGADVIHNHLSHRSLATISLSTVPFLNTIHGTLDKALIPEDKLRTFEHFKDQNYVSISNFQRVHFPGLNWIANAYNGIEVEKFTFEANPKGNYLLWIGRFTETKAPHLAIKYAKQFGMKLILAGKLDQQAPKDLEYFEEKIKPLLNDNEVEWVGEVGHDEKAKLYREASVLLNPIQWDEPFGLVSPEAMACGTPVVTYERGSMAEIIADGTTGFLIAPGNEEQFVTSIGEAMKLDRSLCRKHVEDHFSVGAMTANYLAAYEKAMSK
jgi:glycosyltransferase involved in cell wall biosynthesis